MKYFIPLMVLFTLSTTAFALTDKSELTGKLFESADQECALQIEKNESWKVDCQLLKKSQGTTTLSGKGFNIINCYGDPSCEGIEFLGKLRRPLQAFIIKDLNTPGETSIGLVYGSPADGDVEILFRK